MNQSDFKNISCSDVCGQPLPDSVQICKGSWGSLWRGSWTAWRWRCFGRQAGWNLSYLRLSTRLHGWSSSAWWRCSCHFLPYLKKEKKGPQSDTECDTSWKSNIKVWPVIIHRTETKDKGCNVAYKRCKPIRWDVWFCFWENNLLNTLYTQCNNTFKYQEYLSRREISSKSHSLTEWVQRKHSKTHGILHRAVTVTAWPQYRRLELFTFIISF